MSLPVAILAGGRATRLGEVAAARPKVLMEVAGRPFAEHQIRLLKEAGITRVVWLVGHRAEQVEDALGDGRQWGMRFTFVHDGPAPLGTGGAVRSAVAHLGEAFFVMYGDSYLECDYAAVARASSDSGRAGLMTVYRNDGRWDTSNVELTDGRIAAYDKHTPRAAMHHIDWGLGVFRASAFDRYHAAVPFDLARVYRDLLADDELAAYEVDRRFYEIGSPAGLAETDAYLRNRTR